MTKRIRILFINCPKLDTDAASQLLLAQNMVQSALEFEVLHFWIYALDVRSTRVNLIERMIDTYADAALPGSSWLIRRRRAALDRSAAVFLAKEVRQRTWYTNSTALVSSYLAWMRETRKESVDKDQPTVIITEAPLEKYFFSWTNGNVAIVSAARWRQFFKPVSGMDYLLAATQRAALRMSLAGALSSHYPTRGCLWDYCQNQRDSRIGILSGYICSDCSAALRHTLPDEQVVEIKRLVGNTWIGDVATLHSPASILSKIYRIDLSRASGLSASLFKRIYDAAVPEVGKLVAEALKWTLVILTTVTVASYFPQVVKTYRSLMDDSADAAKRSLISAEPNQDSGGAATDVEKARQKVQPSVRAAPK